MSLKSKICKEIEKKLTKDFLASVIISGQSEPGQPEPQTFNGEVEGYVPPGGEAFAGANLFAHSGWDPVQFPFETSDIVPGTGNAETCGPDIGTLVLNPNLPEGATDTFDITFEILDNTAGLGGIRLFCRSTMEPFGPFQSVSSGGFGTNTGPETHTLTWDISQAPCPPEDIRIAYTAWGATTPDFCDSINPSIETIVVVTPSACLPALECFEKLFGCSLADLILASEVLDDCCDGDDGLPDIPDYMAVTCPATHASGAFGENGIFGQRCNFSVVKREGTTGIYDVTFDVPHTDADYGVVFGMLDNFPPAPTSCIPQVINGTQNANGFSIGVTTHDNGAGADIPADCWVSFSVSTKKQFMVPRNNTSEEIKACFQMTGFDYERNPGFYSSGAFSASVNGVNTTTPWNFNGQGTVKSDAYQAMIDQINATPGWSVQILTDPLMNTTGLVEWEFQYCGPPGEAAVLEIIRTSSGPDTILLDANNNTGSFADDNGEISNDRQPVAC